RVADPPHPRVGQKALGAASGGDEDLPGTGSVILQGYQQHHDSQVLRRIAGFAFGTDAPLAPDLEGYVRGGTVGDVGERHHGDLAARLLAQLCDHGRHVGDGRSVEHAGEIVDVATGGRDRDLEQGAAESHEHGGEEAYVSAPQLDSARLADT